MNLNHHLSKRRHHFFYQPRQELPVQKYTPVNLNQSGKGNDKYFVKIQNEQLKAMNEEIFNILEENENTLIVETDPQQSIEETIPEPELKVEHSPLHHSNHVGAGKKSLNPAAKLISNILKSHR